MSPQTNPEMSEAELFASIVISSAQSTALPTPAAPTSPTLFTTSSIPLDPTRLSLILSPSDAAPLNDLEEGEEPDEEPEDDYVVNDGIELSKKYNSNMEPIGTKKQKLSTTTAVVRQPPAAPQPPAIKLPHTPITPASRPRSLAHAPPLPPGGQTWRPANPSPAPTWDGPNHTSRIKESSAALRGDLQSAEKHLHVITSLMGMKRGEDEREMQHLKAEAENAKLKLLRTEAQLTTWKRRAERAEKLVDEFQRARDERREGEKRRDRGDGRRKRERDVDQPEEKMFAWRE